MARHGRLRDIAAAVHHVRRVWAPGVHFELVSLSLIRRPSTSSVMVVVSGYDQFGLQELLQLNRFHVDGLARGRRRLRRHRALAARPTQCLGIVMNRFEAHEMVAMMGMMVGRVSVVMVVMSSGMMAMRGVVIVTRRRTIVDWPFVELVVSYRMIRSRAKHVWRIVS